MISSKVLRQMDLVFIFFLTQSGFGYQQTEISVPTELANLPLLASNGVAARKRLEQLRANVPTTA
jgi:hypothetical protein